MQSINSGAAQSPSYTARTASNPVVASPPPVASMVVEAEVATKLNQTSFAAEPVNVLHVSGAKLWVAPVAEASVVTHEVPTVNKIDPAQSSLSGAGGQAVAVTLSVYAPSAKLAGSWSNITG